MILKPNVGVPFDWCILFHSGGPEYLQNDLKFNTIENFRKTYPF